MKYLINLLTLVVFLTVTIKAETSHQIDILLAKSGNFIKSNSDSCRFYANKAINQSKAINYLKGVAEANYIQGQLFNYEQNHTAADSVLLYAKSIFISENDSLGLSKVINQMGTSERYKSNFEEALIYFEEAQLIAHNIGDLEQTAICNSNIGVTYDYMGNYPKALDYLLKGLTYFEKENKKEYIAKIRLNMGVIHYYNRDYLKALENFEMAVTLFNKLGDKRNEARTYQNIAGAYTNLNKHKASAEAVKKAKEIAESIGWTSFVIELYNDLGVDEYYKGNYKASLKYYQLAFEGQKTFEASSSSIVTNCINQVYSLIKLERYNQSIEKLNDVIAITKEDKLPIKLQEAQMMMSEVYEAMNKPAKALSYFKQQVALKDSLFNETKSKQIAEMETKYQTAKKDKLLAEKKAENIATQCLLEEEKRANFNQLIGFLALLAAAIFVIIITLLSKRNTELKNKVLKEETENSKQSEQAMNKFNTELHAKNNELKEVNQQLSLLKEELAVRNKTLEADNKELSLAKEQLAKQKDQIKQISLELRHKILLGNEEFNAEEIVFTSTDTNNPNNKIIAFEDKNTESIRIKVSELIEKLPSATFAQVNKSQIVNLMQIKKIEDKKVVLKNGVALSVTKERMKKVKEKWNELDFAL